MATAQDDFVNEKPSGSGDGEKMPIPGGIEDVEEMYLPTKEKAPLPIEPPPPYEAQPGPSSKSNMAAEEGQVRIQQSTIGNSTVLTAQHAPTTSTTIILTNTTNPAPIHHLNYYNPRFCDRMKVNIIMCIVFPPWIVVWVILCFIGV